MRSLLAFWIGGAGSAPVATQGSVRGMLAPWMGGASAAPVTQQLGNRGMLAFWMGGAAPGQEITPPEPPPAQPSLGWGSFPGHGHDYEPWRDVRPKKPAKPTDIALPPLLPREIEAVRTAINDSDDEEALLMILLADEFGDDFS